MNFTEFIEAICRVADRLAIPNLMRDEGVSMDSLSPKQISEYKARPLSQKIEALVLLLSYKCLGKAFYEFTTVNTLKQLEKDGLFANNITVSGYYNK